MAQDEPHIAAIERSPGSKLSYDSSEVADADSQQLSDVSTFRRARLASGIIHAKTRHRICEPHVPGLCVIGRHPEALLHPAVQLVEQMCINADTGRHHE